MPLLSYLNIPTQLSPGILFSIIRKDGMLLFNMHDGFWLKQLSSLQLLLLVFFSSTFTSCTVTMTMLIRHLGWLQSLKMISQQMITASMCITVYMVYRSYLHHLATLIRRQSYENYHYWWLLGGGKTTLLNHLVKDAIDNHLHPAVIMNEFGKQSIDGLLIEQPIPLEEITSGCICCAMKADVSQQLHQLYIHYQPDVVFIECSGVAEPLAVVDACLTPVLSPIVRIDSIVNVIDAAMANKLSTYPDDIQHLFFAQLEHSSTLFINKIDRVDLDSLSEFLVNIGQQHQDADVRVGVQGQLGLSDLIQPQALHAKPSGQHHHRLNHIFIEQPTIVNQHTFIDHLEHLPTHVYRLKGFYALC